MPRCVSDFAAKRFNRTAQAFRPGKAPSKSALKGRPTGPVKMNTLLSMSKDHRIRTTFQGEFLVAKNPGLKPWAKICNRCAVKSDTLLAAKTHK